MRLSRKLAEQIGKALAAAEAKVVIRPVPFVAARASESGA